MRGRMRCWPSGARDIGWTDFDLGETMEVVGYAGFRAMARKHWKNGLAEFRRSLRSGSLCGRASAWCRRCGWKI